MRYTLLLLWHRSFNHPASSPAPGHDTVPCIIQAAILFLGSAPRPRLLSYWKSQLPQGLMGVTEVFPLWNEFKAQRELGAWLTIKLGKTRLKWQLACGEEPSLLSRSGIRPLTGTAVDKTEQNLVPTAFILQRINSNNSGRTRRNNPRCHRRCNRQCNRKISRN